MGHTQSKQVDNTGEIINTVILNPQDIKAENIELILIVLTVEVGISLAYLLYKDYRRSLKKRYNTSQP